MENEKTQQGILSEIDILDCRLSNAEHHLKTASNSITIRNRKNEIKMLKAKIQELKNLIK